jgi:hypothetical protein
MDQIIIGVDTHRSNHIVVATNSQGRRISSVTIPTTRKGYGDLEKWACDLGGLKHSALKARDPMALACRAISSPKATPFWM